MKTLFVLNDAPYGGERTYNALCLAGALGKESGNEARVFLMGDAVTTAHNHQKVPEGFYNTETMLGKVISQHGKVSACHSYMEARGMSDGELTEDASLSYFFGCAGKGKAIVFDLVAGDETWFVIKGDTLFVGATGSPDLTGHEQEMAGVLYDSIHSKLLTLPDELEIFPGHQAGSVCGADLSGKPSSTLGFEKRWNTALSLDKNAFIEQPINNIPPRPMDMGKIVAANTRA